ncbi:MAG: hypothetical protein KatS3mg114_1069 [Planctomycetaceae bacterium]|nr:MAG: hypothetical protein KatS3mg114_1069 [Planctomycetaceae bacterium]
MTEDVREQGGEENHPPIGSPPVGEWYSAYAADLRAFLWGLLRDRELMWEALHNTFAKAMQHAMHLQVDQVRSWLYKVAYHEALMLRRSCRRAAQHHAAHHQQVRQDGYDIPTPQELLLRQEACERVREAVAHLPPELRVVVERRIQQHTFVQIAADLQLPLGTVLTRMRRALSLLHQHLREHSS